MTKAKTVVAVPATKKPETKAERFIRLSETRTANALQKIELLYNLIGTAYEYTPMQTIEIITALRTAIDGLADAFAGKKSASKRFRLTR